MLERIKLYFKRRQFQKHCLQLPCNHCPYFFIDNNEHDKCRLAIMLGLEEE